MAQSITKFFKSLGFKMANDRWSWGSLNDSTLLLRSWQDQYSFRNAEVVVLRPQSGYAETNSLGLPERMKHIESLKSGKIAGYTIIAEAEDPGVRPRTIKSFREDVIYPIVALRMREDGTLLAKLDEHIPVAHLINHAKIHRTEKYLVPSHDITDIVNQTQLPTTNLLESVTNQVGNSEKPDDDLSEREKRFALVEVRTQQASFRLAVFRACGGRCVISGCAVPEALEAAHLHGRDWRAGHNSASDGILLRRDIHALYDRGLLRIEDGCVSLDDLIVGHYGELDKTSLIGILN